MSEKLLKEVKILVENLKKEGKYNPDEEYKFGLNPIGDWIDDQFYHRTILEWGQANPCYVLKRSPRNPDDKRFIMAEFYYIGDKWLIEAKVVDKNEKSESRYFKITSPVSINTICKTLNKIEENLRPILGEKVDTPKLYEPPPFDKYMDDILLRENKNIEKHNQNIENYENSLYKDMFARHDRLHRKIKWSRQ